jgi:transposase
LSGGDLSEVEWRILKMSLPVEREPSKRGQGRPPEDNRNVINGILWRLRTGAPWRDVPEKYGNWNSIYRRFRRWSASDVWESMAIALAETMAESGHYNIDSTSVRAHVSAAGGKGGFINEFLAAREAGCSVISRSTAPSPRETINSPKASSAYYSAPQHATGSNLSTQPRQRVLRVGRKLLHPVAQPRGVDAQILRRLHIRHAPILDQAHSLKLELSRKLPPLQDAPAIP